MQEVKTKFHQGDRVTDGDKTGKVTGVDFSVGTRYNGANSQSTYELAIAYRIQGDDSITFWRNEDSIEAAPKLLNLLQAWARIGAYIQKTAPLIHSGCEDVTGDEVEFKTVRYNAYKFLWSNGYTVSDEDKTEVRALIREAVNE